MFIATMQKERIVAFPRQNGYVNAPQCYVISTLSVLFGLVFYFIVYGFVVSSLHKSASVDTRCFAGGIFFQDTPIYIDLLTLGNNRDSSVGIVTRYGLDGPGIKSRWGRDFSHRSIPALGPTPTLTPFPVCVP